MLFFFYSKHNILLLRTTTIVNLYGCILSIEKNQNYIEWEQIIIGRTSLHLHKNKQFFYELTSFLYFILLCKRLIHNHFYDYKRRSIERKKSWYYLYHHRYYSCTQSSIRLNIMYPKMLEFTLAEIQVEFLLL